MSNPSDHSSDAHLQNNWPELLAGYVLGDLTAAETIQVQQYLDHHPEAIVQVEDLQTTLAVLPIGLPDAALPPDLKARVMATNNSAPSSVVAIESGRSTRSRSASTLNQPKSRGLIFSWPLAGGLAAATIAAFGVQTYILQQELAATRQDIAQLRTTIGQAAQQNSDQNRQQQALNVIAQAPGRILHLAGSGSAASATGTVVISPSQKRAVLMLQNLPPAPVGKVYHLWAMVEGRKVACVQFTPEADQQVLMQLPADRWLPATGVAITLEPEQTTEQPTGEMVMSGAAL